MQADPAVHEWRELPDFARHPIGTGPYRVVRNHPSQMKIHAFDDYFGYRALIDEVNIWVLPEFSEELVHSGVQLQGDETGNSELKADWKRAATSCCSISVLRWPPTPPFAVGCAN